MCAGGIFCIIGRHIIGLYFFRMVPVSGSFWIRVVFPLVIYSGFLLLHTIYSIVEPVFYGWILYLQPESMYSVMAWHFLVCYFLECCSQHVHLYVPLEALFESLLFFVFLLLIQLPFLFCSFCYHISLLKCFCFFYLRSLVYLPVFCIDIFGRISFRCLWNVLFLFVLLDPISLSLSLPSFANSFWSISLKYHFKHVCCFCFGLFIPIYHRVFFLS